MRMDNIEKLCGTLDIRSDMVYNVKKKFESVPSYSARMSVS